MTDFRFFRDPETGLPHLYEHGLDEEDARRVILRPGERLKLPDGLMAAIGQTLSGTYIRVIYCQDESDKSIFVITAYPMSGVPLRAYRRRKRRRHR